MNNLRKIDKWTIYSFGNGEEIAGLLVDGDRIEKFIGKVLRIDFEKHLVETDEGYFELGVEA